MLGPETKQSLPKKPYEAFLSNDHLHDNLRARTLRGGAITIVAQAIRFVLNLGSTMVLARLLDVADYGLVAMVTAITAFATMFKDLGLSAATIQRSTITHEQVSTLFWVNVLFGSMLTLLMVGVSPGIAWFYGDWRLMPVGAALSLVYLASGFSVQHQALLTRQMRFRQLATIDLSALTSGVLVAIASAFLGAGYWTLVLLPLTVSVVSALLLWLVCPWHPGKPVRYAGVRPMLSVGGFLTGFQVVNYFGRNMDAVLVGRWWGATALGYYTRAYSLLMLPIGQINNPITAVVMPSLSRLQDDPARFRRLYSAYVSTLSMVTLPVVAFLIVLANAVIAVALGARWSPAAEIFQALGWAALPQVVLNTTGALMISTGGTRRMFLLSLFAVAGAVLSFCIGLPYGAKGVAVAYAIFNWLSLLPLLVGAVWGTPVSTRDILAATWRGYVLAAVVACCVWLIGEQLVERLAPLGALAVSASVAATVWIAMNVTVFRADSPLKHLRELYSGRGS